MNPRFAREMSRAGKKIVEVDSEGEPVMSEEEREWGEQPAHAAKRAERRADAMRVLDVGSNDDASAVKQAYRKLAMRHHPDKHRDDPEAERKFKEIVRAYDTLTREYGLMGDGHGGGAFQDRFETAADMRDFAASFFESFFFGGGGMGGQGMFGRRGSRDYDDASSRDDYDSEDDSLASLEDYDDEDYSDDEEYTDLHNFFESEASGWAPRDMPGKWFGRPRDSQGTTSKGRPSMTDDQLFEHLEQMRKEAARYAAELAKQENEARRANEPLEKLQRPTMVSRTDDSMTLNLSRAKSTTQNLPQDRCWELSMKKEKDQSYTVYDTVKGTCVVTVTNLLPGTKYAYKARVGRVDESTGEVTEWGPYSVESMYATSGKAPVGNSGKQSEAKGEEVVVEAGMGKKAKKRAAKEQAEKEERERAAEAEKQGTATVVDEAAARQAALRKAAEEAAEREMAEMEEIRKRVEAVKKPDVVKTTASAGEGLSKKAAQRKKKKERAKAEEAAKAAGVDVQSVPHETDEELARRLQAEEERSAAVDARYNQTTKPPVPTGPPPSWAAAPAMRMPVRKVEQGATVQASYGAPQPPHSAPPPGQSRIPIPRVNDELQGPPPLPPGPRPTSAYATAQAQMPPPHPAASTSPQAASVWGSGQSLGVTAASTWGETKTMQPAMMAPPSQAVPQLQPQGQPASWSPANSNWQPMGQGSGMGTLPVDYGFASESQRLPPSTDLFPAVDRNWAPSPAPAPAAAATHWSGQASWNDGGGAQGVPGADWGLGDLGVNADLNPGTPSWSTFGGTSPVTGPGMWSNPQNPNGLSVDVERMRLGGQRQQQTAPRSPATPDGDPNLIDSSLLSFLG